MNEPLKFAARSQTVPKAQPCDLRDTRLAKCPTHLRYKALKAPRVACEQCWIMYFGMSETCRNCGCQEIE